jgi:hypothetical protein
MGRNIAAQRSRLTINLAKWIQEVRRRNSSISCSAYLLKGVEMTNETIKILLMVMLLGGLRIAIFVTEMPKAQPWSLHSAFLDWMIALFWPAMPGPASART